MASCIDGSFHFKAWDYRFIRQMTKKCEIKLLESKNSYQFPKTSVSERLLLGHWVGVESRISSVDRNDKRNLWD